MMMMIVVIIFMSMGRDYVSELQPPTGLLFIPQVKRPENVKVSNTVNARPTRLTNVTLYGTDGGYGKAAVEGERKDSKVIDVL
jgi:hypothetical protein